MNHPHHSRRGKNRRRPELPSSSETVTTDYSSYSLATSTASSVGTVGTVGTFGTFGTFGSVFVGSGANKNNRNLIVGLVMALCLLNIIEVDIVVDNAGGGSGVGRRSLLSSLYLAGPSTLLPWAQHHLVDVTERPDPVAETALFWHIPKSGGTTAKRLYQCMGQTLAHRVGADPKYGHVQKDEVVVFEPHEGKDWKVVNVDTTIKSGIIRAKKIGLVQSHTTDLIFTMEPNFAGRELYDEENRGRFLALFRHPVDRAFSMFFYLQSATWEKTYRPEWANMTVLEWANLPNAEEDYMVRKLVGKTFGMEADETDLIIAKELVRQRFIVGLMGEMNESIRRFNIVLGIDEESERSQKCMEEFGLVMTPKEDTTPAVVEDKKPVNEGGQNLEDKTRATDKKNSNSHPKFEEGSPEYDAVAARNPLDMLLYKYVESLFEAQKEIVDSFLEDPVESQEEDEEEAEILEPQDERNLALLPPSSAVESFSHESPRGKPSHLVDSFLEDPEESQDAMLPPGSAVESFSHGSPRDILSHLADVNSPVQGRDFETPFFWHVPKSGGTTLQRLYWCMGSTIANEVGVNPKFGIEHGEKSDIVAFSPWKDRGNPGKVINVDVCTHEGILEAKNRGFLTSRFQPKTDFVSTSEFQFASMNLFSPDHKARLFALFRHPIDAAVSKFYYLQKATWEPTYNKRWASMSLEDWSKQDRGDNNWMVRSLIGKSPRLELTMDDYEIAKEIVRTKFVVGLMDKFEESVHRFNILLGIDESDYKNQACIEEFSANEGDGNSVRNQDKIVKKNQFNSYSHPKAVRGSDVWVSLSKIHVYDVMLYKYVLDLFRRQEEMFSSSPSQM